MHTIVRSGEQRSWLPCYVSRSTVFFRTERSGTFYLGIDCEKDSPANLRAIPSNIAAFSTMMLRFQATVRSLLISNLFASTLASDETSTHVTRVIRPCFSRSKYIRGEERDLQSELSGKEPICRFALCMTT